MGSTARSWGRSLRSLPPPSGTARNVRRGGAEAPPLLHLLTSSDGHLITRSPEGAGGRIHDLEKGRGPRDLRLVAGLLMRPKPHTAPRPPSAPRAKCSEQPLRVLRTDSVGSPFRWALGPSELPRPHSQLAFPTARPGTPSRPYGFPRGPRRAFRARRSGCSERAKTKRGRLSGQLAKTPGGNASSQVRARFFLVTHSPAPQATEAGVRSGSSSVYTPSTPSVAPSQPNAAARRRPARPSSPARAGSSMIWSRRSA